MLRDGSQNAEASRLTTAPDLYSGESRKRPCGFDSHPRLQSQTVRLFGPARGSGPSCQFEAKQATRRPASRISEVEQPPTHLPLGRDSSLQERRDSGVGNPAEIKYFWLSLEGAQVRRGSRCQRFPPLPRRQRVIGECRIGKLATALRSASRHSPMTRTPRRT